MHRNLKIIILLFAGLIISLILSVSLGSVSISPSDIINPDAISTKILFEIRLPRSLNAMLIGAALSCSGIILQTLLKNNLAEPGLLGISSGAGLGAIIYFLVPGFSFIFITPVSFITALSAAALIFYISKGINNKYTNFLSSNKIILAGIAINSIISSINGFLLIYSGKSLTHIIYWMSGGLSGKGWMEFYSTFIFILAGLVITLMLSKEFNVLMLGEEMAKSIGLNIKKIQTISIVISAILAASSVAIAGIISFVGLIVPNISKLIFGENHKYSIIGSILLGSIFLLISDLIARTIISPSEIPVGIVTSFIGSPVFIWLILKSKK